MIDFCDKKEARKYFANIRNNISDNDKSVKSKALTDAFLSLPEYRNAKVILSYYPIKSEPAIDEIIDRSISDKKIIALPVSLKDEHMLVFKVVNSKDELKTGEYNIPEPIGRIVTDDELSGALCIVPALAFDTNGNRLGYGGGYYDRFLASFKGISVCLIYSDLQSKCTLPTDEYDIKPNMIITEKGEAYRNEYGKEFNEKGQEASLLKG